MTIYNLERHSHIWLMDKSISNSQIKFSKLTMFQNSYCAPSQGPTHTPSIFLHLLPPRQDVHGPGTDSSWCPRLAPGFSICGLCG